MAEADINPIKFSYNALRIATKNFLEDMKLGAGGFGVVYKVSFFTLTTNNDCLRRNYGSWSIGGKGYRSICGYT